METRTVRSISKEIPIDAIPAAVGKELNIMANDRWIYGVCAVSVLVLAYGALIVRGTLTRRRILRDRRGVNVENFVEEFVGSEYSRAVLEMAYQDLGALAQMPVRRTDDLEMTLGLLPEDFEAMIENRCRNLGLNDVWKSPHASLFPLKTTEDYVRFLSVIRAEK
jgi:hypothetical protein